MPRNVRFGNNLLIYTEVIFHKQIYKQAYPVTFWSQKSQKSALCIYICKELINHSLSLIQTGVILQKQTCKQSPPETLTFST